VSAGSWQIVLAQDCFADVGNNVAFVYPVEPNDIIEYDGNNWQLVFDSINTLADQFVKNNFSQKWYKWQNQTWTAFPYKGSTGDYGPGYWRLSL
jgi:hypothetical protein